jgi:hypothetical protein
MSLLRALALTACAWGVAFLWTWILVVTFAEGGR